MLDANKGSQFLVERRLVLLPAGAQLHAEGLMERFRRLGASLEQPRMGLSKVDLHDTSVVVGLKHRSVLSQLVEALRAEKAIQEHCIIDEMSCPNKVCDHSRRSPVVKIDGDYILEAKLEAIMDDVHTRIEKKREAKP